MNARNPICTASTLLLMLTSFWISSGCTTTKYNVGPLYDGAIQNFESAKEFELKAIETSAAARASLVASILDELEKLTLSQLRILVVSQWNGAEKDFKVLHREGSYRALLGIGADQEIPQSELIWLLGALDRHLSEVFSYNTTDGTLVKDAVGRPITAYDIFSRGGIEGLRDPLVPALDEKQRVRDQYGSWLTRLNEDILGGMPVVQKTRGLKETLLQSIKDEQEKRTQNSEQVYTSLINITTSAKAYAEALEENEQWASLANSIFGQAKVLLPLLPKVEPETNEIP